MASCLASETKVESIHHRDKRKNIPTEELGDFIADDGPRINCEASLSFSDGGIPG
jgi:hypothetical protein